MGVMKGKIDPVRASDLCDRLRGVDYGLMQLVLDCQDAMNLKASGDLVAMQRALRRLRHQIEAEAGL